MAELNVSLPVFLPNSTTEEKLEALLNYSRRVNEQLRFVLSNLETENFTPAQAKLIADAGKAKETADGASEKMNTAVREMKKNAAEIRSCVEEISARLSDTRQWVSDNYLLTEEAQTTYALTGSGLQMEQVWRQIADTVNGIFGDGAENEAVRQYHGFIRAGLVETEDGETSGIVISSGSAEGSFETVYTPARLEFRQGGRLLAYFSNEDLYIPAIRTQRLRFGTREGEAFAFLQNGDRLILRYGTAE